MSNINNTIINAGLAAADLSAGDFVKLDSNGEVAKLTSAEATDCIGIVTQDVNSGDAVPVLAQGVYDSLRVLVEDTDSSSGYDHAIAAGEHLLISGKSAGTYTPGQACSSIQGTGVTTADATTIVAKALEAVAGSTSADTYTTIKAYVDFMR